jgi:hypothetical protein
VLCEHQPELVTRYPNLKGNDEEDVYGFIGGAAIVSTRENEPYLWVVLQPGRHIDIEFLIRAHGTPEEQSNTARYKRGFISNGGRFVSRIAARSIAGAAGQLLPNAAKHPELYTDDVW